MCQKDGGGGQDAKGAANVEVAARDDALSIFFDDESRADEETADGKEDVDSEVAVFVQPRGAEGADAVEGVMVGHDGEDGDGAPAVQSWQIAGWADGFDCGLR